MPSAWPLENLHSRSIRTTRLTLVVLVVNSPTEEIPSGDFAHGFAMGAVAFWKKVKDQL